MAHNAVHRTGKSGNFADTYQETTVGNVIVAEDAPVVQILTSATRGVIATPDADKWWPRRMVEWIYTLVMSFADNPIKKSIKNGDYEPDTTAEPYASLAPTRAARSTASGRRRLICTMAPCHAVGPAPAPERPADIVQGRRARIRSEQGRLRTNKGEDFGDVKSAGNSNLGHDYFCKRSRRQIRSRKRFSRKLVNRRLISRGHSPAANPRARKEPEVEEVDCMTPTRSTT